MAVSSTHAGEGATSAAAKPSALRRRLGVALFWTGEVLGAVSLFVILYVALVAGWVLQ